MCLCYFSQHVIGVGKPFVHTCTKSVTWRPAAGTNRSNLWPWLSYPTPISPYQHSWCWTSATDSWRKKISFFLISKNVANCRKPLGKYIYLVIIIMMIAHINWGFLLKRALLCVYFAHCRLQVALRSVKFIMSKQWGFLSKNISTWCPLMLYSHMRKQCLETAA